MDNDQPEMLDVVDSDLRILGTADRERVHREGLWHQTFHCWVYRREADHIRLIFQLRHPASKANPDRLDVSAAGHLLHGETREEGIRELEEELGIRAPFGELIPLGVWKEEMDLGEGWIDREYRHVYLYECRKPLKEYRPQPEEVSGLFEADLGSIDRLFRGEQKTADLTGFKVTDGGRQLKERRTAVRQDFVPHSEGYYRLVLDALKQREMES
ncbi:isopentenyldiphosphate isomerase [Melghirimyces profundicolus]|uniref:Isopentenyldiphosphate isomerase n=1 Tax=Melghirimyces profundicolus TaxID=1242148 RepID=A0A2T6BCD6_9BACL|nr:NUDIX domain-containing protein [Melghirimyces profundicolus]PTX53694.1 isopentenyldiphosphate isomerase [Melghirimyces profundicolus]